jgi:hypothetical protein
MMLFAGMAMGQLKVFSDGNTLVGDNTGMTGAEETLQVNGRMLIEDGSVVRSGASASLMFDRQDESAFIIGAGNDAGMSWDRQFDFELRSNSRSRIVNNRFIQNGQLRFKILGSNGNVGIGTASPTQRLHVNGNIFATGNITPSDMRLKNLMKSDNLPGLSEVLKIEVVRYQYNGKAGISSAEPHIGVVAQELQKIAPALVGEYMHVEEDEFGEKVAEETYLNIRDSEIKYMLVNAIQEQQVMIEELQSQIEELKASTASVNDRVSSDVDLVDIAQSTLGQNSPNPYNEGTVISYSVADNATSAKMNFYNLTGQLIKSVSLQNGAGQVNVSADELPSGTYTYSLEVDGALISNKKMVKMR